jgi:hypothetical protein
MVVFLRSPVAWIELICSKPLAAGLGLATHFVLNNGEWDHSSHTLLYAWVAAFGVITTVGYTLDSNITSMADAFQVSGIAFIVYFGTLLKSVLIY